MYQVKCEKFEGPLALLLKMIESEKLDITQVSLAEVADDYLEYIKDNPKIDLANLSEFLLVASQLIFIKSKALLPLFEFTEEEEEEIEDLQERLKEYQRFKKASMQIKALADRDDCCFSKTEEKEVVWKKFIPPQIGQNDLKKTFEEILGAMPEKEEIAKEVIKEIISLEEKIVEIKITLEKRMKVAFHETVKEAGDKIEVVVSFLAMLEMIKQKTISVKQEKLFDDIMIESKNKKQESVVEESEVKEN